MLKIVNLVVLLVLVLLGIVFAVLNADRVQLNYYFGSVDIPLSLVLVVAMIIGAILGVLASLKMLVSARREILVLRRSSQLAEKEINNLRKLPIKDEH